MVTILDGKKVALEIKSKLKEKIAQESADLCLAIVQVGNDARSNIYVGRKIAYGNSVGIKTEHIRLDCNINKADLINKIDELNKRTDITGIIVQLPLPASIQDFDIFSHIDRDKDVDGLGKLSKHVPATARAIMMLLDSYGINICGKHVVIIGRSNLVGKPTALQCLSRDATVTICHSKTENLEEITKLAHIIIVAVGKKNILTKDHVRQGQVVIDVGINPVTENTEGGKGVVGDVDFKKVSEIVEYISPVPGGVGPMTVACLFENVYDAYYNKKT